MFRMRSLVTILVWFAATAMAQADCIGVITAGGGQAFWQDVERGALRAARELDIPVFVRGPIDEVDVQAQDTLIRWVVNNRCGGLVLAPNDPSHGAAVTRLRDMGIPTVFIDRDIGGDRVSVIKTNNRQAGERAGLAMVDALNGTGTVAVLRMDAAVQTTTERENAFIETVTAAGLDVVIDDYIGTRVGTAREQAHRLLTAHPPTDGLFTPNESTTLSAQAALQQLPDRRRPVHIGFDANPLLVNAIRSGRLYGLIVQDPVQMGYQGVHRVYQAMRGETIEPAYDVPVTFMTMEEASAAGGDRN